MKICKGIVLVLLVISILVGCGSNPLRTGIPPSFIEGLAAMDRKDFAEASYHFAELAKGGNPGSMNNLGVSLLMVDRKDEAIYWFKKASRYGNSDAKLTLQSMGEDIPPSDLVGQHPTQLQQEATDKFIVATLLGVAVGVTVFYASQGSLNRYNYGLNNGYRSQTNSSALRLVGGPSGAYDDANSTEVLRMAPDGSYVVGTPRMAPDGTYVGGTPRMAPDGSYVVGTPHMAPDGTYVGGTPRMAPDGTYVGGTPRMAPDGSYVGIGAR